MKILAELWFNGVKNAMRVARDTPSDMTRVMSMQRVGDVLELTKYSEGVAHRTWVDAEFDGDEAVDAVLNAAMLSHALDGMLGNVDVSVTPQAVVIQGRNREVRLGQLGTWDPREIWPSFGEKKLFSYIPPIDVMSTVCLASLRDESRPALSCVHLRGGDGHTIVEATDSFRMARAVLDGDIGDVDVLIPTEDLTRSLEVVRSMRELTLCRLEGHSEGWNVLDIFTGDADVLLYLPDMSVKMPDLDPILNRISAKYRIRVRAPELLDALERCLPFGRIDRTSSRVALTVRGGFLTVDAAAEEGAIKADVPCQGDALDYRISVNANMLADTLRRESEVELGFGESRSDAITVQGKAVKWVVMPMVLYEREEEDDD